jgi:hypothetical protein
MREITPYHRAANIQYQGVVLRLSARDEAFHGVDGRQTQATRTSRFERLLN